MKTFVARARTVAAALLAALLAACGTTYKPQTVNAQTGLYQASADVAPGGIEVGEKSVSLDEFGAVVLVASSNQYAARLEFLTRKALAELGLTNVVNIRELTQWAEDEKFSFAGGVNLEAVKAFSSAVKPVLVVEMRYVWLGSPQHFASLRVTDGRDGASLLNVTHPKHVWVSADDEVIYPVLNELRKWRQKLPAKSAQGTKL